MSGLYIRHHKPQASSARPSVLGTMTPELRSPVVALSLGGLRRKIEIAMLPDDVRVVLQLDGLAERERHRRRAQAQLSRIAQLDQRTALPDQCLHSAEADVRPPRRKSGFDPNRSCIAHSIACRRARATLAEFGCRAAAGDWVSYGAHACMIASRSRHLRQHRTSRRLERMSIFLRCCTSNWRSSSF